MINSFSNSVLSNLGYYIYALVDPRSGRVFYIGKGQNNRVFDHAKGVPSSSSSSKNEKISTIKKILSSGCNVEYFIIRHGLTEKEAIVGESILIDIFTNKILKKRIILNVGLTNKQAGHDMRELGIRTVDDIEAQYGATPLGKITDPLVIININKTYKSTTNIYEATRKSWRISKKRADKAKYILSEYKGVVRAVFEMNNKKWQPEPKKTGKVQRYYFEGNEVTNPAVLATYINKSIIKKKGDSNPIHYLNIS